MIKRTEKVENVEKLIDLFISEKQAQGISTRSASDYKVDLNKFFSYVENITEVTNSNFCEQINNMLETKKPVTVNHYIREYRAFLYWCMTNGYISEFKIKTVKAQEAPIRLYSIEDIEKLLVKPKHTDNFATWRTWAIVSFIMATGARAGTLCEIQLSDLDLANQEVVYRHSKNKRAPIIPICDQLKNNLIQYIKEFQLKDYLFPNQDGTMSNSRALKQAFEKYCNRHNVEYNSFHALRHSYAKQFIVNGGNPFQLQKMLNHQTLTMSQHYTHLFGTDLHGAVNDYSPLSKIAQPTGIKRR